MSVSTEFRHRLEYMAVWIPYHLIRHLPYCVVKFIARCGGCLVHAAPSARRIVRANIHAAMPELPESEVNRIARESFYHIAWNLLEFFWLDGKPARIRRCYYLPEEITEQLKGHVARGERIIFVNPHLGSWEASGVMAPFYAGVRMVAIAKPVKNPYFNRILNRGSREKVPGLEIIFSNGAIRAALKALRAGLGVGTLIDQNTRGRDGGVFVDFFGLPVPSSTAPANLMAYCRLHKIPAVIIYGTSVRHADGRITAHSEYLPKPFEEYADEKEVLQDLMRISEKYIRRYPEQYLWFYKRFQYIPPECPDELRARYPFYARDISAHFFRKTARDLAEEAGR